MFLFVVIILVIILVIYLGIIFSKNTNIVCDDFYVRKEKVGCDFVNSNDTFTSKVAVLDDVYQNSGKYFLSVRSRRSPDVRATRPKVSNNRRCCQPNQTQSGPGRIRTFNQAVMSRLLCH